VIGKKPNIINPGRQAYYDLMKRHIISCFQGCGGTSLIRKRVSGKASFITSGLTDR
jgi:hypothetical protein